MKLQNLCFLLLILSFLPTSAQDNKKQMMFADGTRKTNPYAADAHVILFKGTYYMYYTAPPLLSDNQLLKGWRIGIAKSRDLMNWKFAGEVVPSEWYEQRGISSPYALVEKDKVHLIYQTYGNEFNVILHATSEDAMHFDKDENSPVFVAKGDWNNGSSTDAEVVPTKHRYKLYYSTVDPKTGEKVISVASAPLVTTFSRREWVQDVDSAILRPKYPWEGKSVSSPSVIEHKGLYYMFYAGARTNAPQQIGVASSRDGNTWTRLSNKPFFENGDKGTWNMAESGKPHVFKAEDGRTYLFFQGNDDGLSSYISKVEIGWNDEGPYVME